MAQVATAVAAIAGTLGINTGWSKLRSNGMSRRIERVEARLDEVREDVAWIRGKLDRD